MVYDGAKTQVERFAGRFGEPYRLLAYHAALPLTLTPELLNYLRNKFLGEKVPWVAEVDLLLSDLCQEIGYEEFAMDSATRAYLLAEADEKLGRPHMCEVARLLIRYVHSLSSSASAATAGHELQAQRWAAMVYLDDQRESAVQEIAESFLRSMTTSAQGAGRLGASLVDESELARLSQITQMLAPQLGASRELVEYAAEVSRILAARRDDAQPPAKGSRPARVGSLTLPAPATVLRETAQGGRPAEVADWVAADDAVGDDVFISCVIDERPFLDNLLSALRAAGLKYTLEFSETGGDPIQAQDPERAMNACRHTLFIVTPDWVNAVWPLYEKILDSVPNAHNLEGKILLAVVRPAVLPDRLAAMESYDLATRDEELRADTLDDLIDRLLKEPDSEDAAGSAPDAPQIIGESPAIRRAIDTALSAGDVDSVLITGETGTGKELFARFIHSNSARRKGPFVLINCAVLPEAHMETQLFGYTRGAFSGATADNKGLFESANGGTLFFDEIAEIPLSVQAKLLHVLDIWAVRPVGSRNYVSIDARFIFATNRDLIAMSEQGDFRRDLLARLNTAQINIPPLRERGEDILLLAYHFLEQYWVEWATRGAPRVSGISEPALRAFMRYNWPGNVRELRYVIRRAATYASGRQIELEDLPDSIVRFGGKDHRPLVYLTYQADSDSLQSLVAAEISKGLAGDCRVFDARQANKDTYLPDRRALENADVFIAILSGSDTYSEWFVTEARLARQLAEDRRGSLEVVPLCIDPIESLPRPLDELFPRESWLMWRAPGTLKELIEQLRQIILRKQRRAENETGGPPPQADEVSPASAREQFVASLKEIDWMIERGEVRAALHAADRLLQRSLEGGEEAYPEAAHDLGMAHLALSSVLQASGSYVDALPLLREAQRRFEALARDGNTSAAQMVAEVLIESGDCYAYLGRLNEAEAAYKESSKRADAQGDQNRAAIAKGQLGNVLLNQGRFDEALAAYEEARRGFEASASSQAVATIWHRIGIAYRYSGHYERAEQSYRQSLAISVQQQDRAGEGDNLNELGNLYVQMGRLDEAVTCYWEAAKIFLGLQNMSREGGVRSNLAHVLLQQGRFDEARHELQRAIQCLEGYGSSAEPWKTWSLLQQLETATGNPEAATRARRKAIDSYLEYRKAGGSSTAPAARLYEMAAEVIAAGDTSELKTFLSKPLEDGAPAWATVLFQKVLAVLRGERDLSLAEDPALDYDDAAELLLLLEKVKPR